MESMPEKWVPFRTDLILRKRKKSHGARLGNMGGVLKLQCFFQRETDEYSGLCEQKRYRDGARPVKARKSKSKVKVMLIVFFDIQGIVYFEFLPQGQAVNQTVYKEIFLRLVESVRDKRRSLWEAHAWALHHDNASAHTALSIRQFLSERNIATLEHPPYFPNLTPCDFFSFLRSNLF